MNAASEEVAEISGDEIKHALSQTRVGGTPEEDGITTDVLEVGGDTIIIAMKMLLKKCLNEGKIPNNWQNALVISLHTNGH
ncbi:hypothetical protein Trydic_g13698 [Trypoxylus dichotomus]